MGVGHPRNHNRRDKVTIGLITCCASKVSGLPCKAIPNPPLEPIASGIAVNGALPPARPQSEGRSHDWAHNLLHIKSGLTEG
ncbi:MAG: hypothetical protein BJ554DRAFT_1885 [Olpidium bornovanus]|uniref:Uncharacterized protein n=1 Tax=Olpidium bornovanus TaxID=278681 RepID=A0A8H8DH46_9FUNG|nr:MAG: hypothetical protein BJ554DRAFT_1885 [Olpidium bornovanus]